MPLEVSLLKNKYFILTISWTVFAVVIAFFSRPVLPCTGVIIANVYFVAFLKDMDGREK